jgi:hypothetical protein
MLKGNSNKKVGFRLDFLVEFKAIFKTALAHESGPLGGLFDEKPREENPFKVQKVIRSDFTKFV